MTLIKSLLLGSAAGIVAVASAQAADLPTKKAAPVEYVKVCNVGGITGTSPSVIAATPSYILSNSQLNQRVLVAASTPNGNTNFFRNEFGWTSRMNFGFDIASNTAYGPLIGHFDLNSEMGNGFTTPAPQFTSTPAT